MLIHVDTCSDADRPFVRVTPRTVSDVIRAVTGISGGAAISAWRHLFLSTTIISFYFFLTFVQRQVICTCPCIDVFEFDGSRISIPGRDE